MFGALLYVCALAATVPPSITAVPAARQVASCQSLLSQYSSWNTGWNGRVSIPIQAAMTSWTVEFEFTAALTSFEQWTGTTTVIGSTLYSVYHNAALSAGSSLAFDFLYRYNLGATVPTVLAIRLNGQDMCTGGGSVSSTTSATTVTQPLYMGSGCVAAGTTYDYDEVLHKSLLFYEAQRSGYLPATQRVTWRKTSATNDAIDDSTQQQVNLEGGYYDAGDYVKFGYPMASMTTVLAWGAIDYGTAYEAAGEMTYMLAAVKWATDYFIKAHPQANVFYGQVGDGNLDHAYWGRPEDMTMYRPAFKLTTAKPGSDLAGETAAALAAASILFNTSNSTYAAICLQHAVQLYNFATQYRGKYADSITNAASFYNSWGTYIDELAWAAAWLYRATGNNTYLTQAASFYTQLSSGVSEFSWAEKTPGVQVLLGQYADANNRPTYLSDLKIFCDRIIDTTPRTPKGLVFIGQWGTLRYAANAAFICLRAADLGVSPTKYRNFCKQQIHYALGDAGRSFVVGYGVNPPVQPHHKSSSCPLAPAPCDWNTYSLNGPNPHVLTGALVGGPDANDYYVDVRSDYVKNEVTTDYNAGFQSAVAALRVLANCGSVASSTTNASTTKTSTASTSTTKTSSTTKSTTKTTSPTTGTTTKSTTKPTTKASTTTKFTTTTKPTTKASTTTKSTTTTKPTTKASTTTKSTTTTKTTTKASTTTKSTTTTKASTTTKSTTRVNISTTMRTPVCIKVRETSAWQYNYQIELNVTFPVTVSTWSLVLMFSGSITNIQAWTAVESFNGNTATLSNESYNGFQSAGSSLVLGMQITYVTTTKPALTAITLNGASVCIQNI